MLISHDLLTRLAAPSIDCALDFAARRDALAVEEKTRGEFVTQADRAVEEVIRASLRAELGDVALLGEEGGGSLDTDNSGWVVDPIDGTTNFLRGLPLWGISIGYIERGEPAAGVIALPELGVTLSAVRGDGVQCNGAPFERPVTPPAVKLIALGENDFEPGHDVDARANGLREAGFSVVRYFCASFSIASAVLGWTDGYIERGCSLWDIAAGAVIGREAGLRVQMNRITLERWAIEVRG